MDRKRGYGLFSAVFGVMLLVAFAVVGTFAAASENDSRLSVVVNDIAASSSDEVASDAATTDSDAADATADEATTADAASELSATDQTLTATLEDGTIVTVQAPAGVLPDGVTVDAKAVEQQEVIDAVTSEVEKDGTVAGVVKAIDVTLRDVDGNEVQPNGKLTVTFSQTGMESDDISVYHVKTPDDTPVDEVVASDLTVEQVETAKAEADEQVFETTHFSIYAIVDTGEIARLKLVFHKADGTDPTEIYVKKGDDVDAVVYDPGAGTLQSGYVFRGWTTDANYTGATTPMTIADVRDLVESKLPAARDGDALDLYPIVLKAISVSYLDANDTSLGTTTLYLDPGQTSLAYTVNMNYTPPSSYQNFEGWKVKSGGGGIDGYVDDTIYRNGTQLMLSGSVVFSVNAPVGHWLVFDENGRDATYNAPQFIKDGGTTSEPSLEMRRPGYDFDGWYTAATGGQRFTFGGELSDNTTVYAHWTAKTRTTYTVLIWKQNVSGQGYDFSEAVTLTGAVGQPVNTVASHGYGDNAYASVNDTNKLYEGFHLDRFDQNVIVNTEGTALVNVYYDRNVVTLTFRYRSGGRWVTQQTMTGLYGQRLEDTGYTWPTNRWWYDDYSQNYWGYYGTGTRTTFMDAFLPPTGTSETFYGFNAQGNNNVDFYKQNADGNGYTLANKVTSAAGTFYISDKYTGYRAAQYRVNGGEWIDLGDKNPATGYYASVSGWSSLEIRFDPARYGILYEDGVYVSGGGNPIDGYTGGTVLKEEKDIAYGSDMDSYNSGGANYYAPTRAGFVFAGWYIDENCTQPYTFTTMTEGITVYAKWVQTQYRVFLHPNAEVNGQPDSTLDWGSDAQQMNFRISHGGKVSAPTGLRDGYEFVGWYLDEDLTQVFNADAFVLNDTTVTAPYDKTTDMTDPMDRWGNIGAGASNSDVDRFWITRKLDLYAKWRQTLTGAKGIGIIYDAAGGENAPSDSTLYLDNSTAVAGAASTAPEGMQFKYWVVQTWDAAANGGQGGYVDTTTTVFPGDTFTVLKDYSKVVENEGSTPDNPSYSYTMQLRAEYVAKGSPTSTKVVFDSNGGEFGDGATQVSGIVDLNEKINVPADPTRYGYIFQGWGTTADATGFAVAADPKLAAANGYAADNLNGVAWDADQQANVLYAVWQPAPVTLTVQKEIVGTQADLTKKFDFTVSVTSGGKEYTATAQLGDTDLAYDNGEAKAFSTLTAADGSTHTLSYGDTVTVREGTADGYTTTYHVLDNPDVAGTTASLDLQNGADGTINVRQSSADYTYSSKVVFVNEKTAIPTTGIKSETGSNALQLALGVGAGVALASVVATRMRRDRWRG